jgi:hypothetical protein
VRDEPKDWKLISDRALQHLLPSDELLPRAKEFAAWFERARTEHVQTMGVQPPRIHVFLYRSYHDLQQSSFLGRRAPGAPAPAHPLADAPRAPPPERQCLECRPIPSRRALALAEPLRNRIFIHCQASDRWNYWFLKHELAHQFQFEHLFAFRLPSWLITLKDPIVPQWWWEGGADYWAGIFDSEKDTWVRDLANERLYDLKELHTPDILNPYDYLAVYYEGSYFWRFLDDEYGPGTGRKVFDRTDHGLPIASQKPVQYVVGKDRKAIERDFEANLRQKWAGIMAGRTVPSDRLSDTREYYRRHTLGGRWSPDGNHLAWVSDDKVVPDLFVDGSGLLGADRSLDGSRLVSIPAWSPDGRQLVVVEQRKNFDRFLLVNVDGGSEAIYVDVDEIYDPSTPPTGRRSSSPPSRTARATSTRWPSRTGRSSGSRTIRTAISARPTRRTGAWPGSRRPKGARCSTSTGSPSPNPGRCSGIPSGRRTGSRSCSRRTSAASGTPSRSIPATGTAKRLTKFKGAVTYPAWHPTDGTLVITYFEGRGTDLYRVAPQPQDEPGFDEENRKPWYDQFKKGAPQGTPEEKSRVFGVNWLQFPVASYSLLYPGVEFVMGDRTRRTRSRSPPTARAAATGRPGRSSPTRAGVRRSASPARSADPRTCWKP